MEVVLFLMLMTHSVFCFSVLLYPFHFSLCVRNSLSLGIFFSGPPYFLLKWHIITYTLWIFFGFSSYLITLTTPCWFSYNHLYATSELHVLHTSYPFCPFPLANHARGLPNTRWQPLLPHPPVRVFCCRITLCLLRFVLFSHLITTTGEVTGIGLCKIKTNTWRGWCR